MISIQMNRWNPAIAGLALFAMTGATAPAFAQTPAAAPPLVGQCREAKVSTPIFSQRSSTSGTVSLLATAQKVTLAENAVTNGFILVSTPNKGYVQAVNLRACTGVQPPDKGLCRRVTQPLGLAIRQAPNTTSAIVGGAELNSQVFVTTNPATAQTASNGRIWVQIARPAAGWVSNGFRNTPGSNLVYCK
ncbi:MAG: SH3 domain-containing protein [Phormidesmis sp. CAN_BIN44]|nr:SH3 domain-containing protein [Phormidesmis sp. CAN_BIN44]